MRLAAFVCHLKTTWTFCSRTTNLSAIRNVSHEAEPGGGGMSGYLEEENKLIGHYFFVSSLCFSPNKL
jgi:hypothetical protein